MDNKTNLKKTNKFLYYILYLLLIVVLVGASVFVGNMIMETWKSSGVWSILFWIIGGFLLFIMINVDAYVRNKFLRR